jgi:CubicO group peptidase (beta-lactamase class C family)
MKLFFVILSVVVFTTDALGYPPLEAPLLEAFIDGSVKTAMEDQHLPGVTVSVVQDGRLVLAKGYGLARTDPPQPVVADQTLFRIGSISKTFTFTGVMQLVELGRLDLNADIGPIISDVNIEDSYGPITMIDLMTHSAGFEDAYLGFFYADSLETDLAATEFLNRYAPHRVRPPGEQIVYSNFGVDLAGKVIESVSGENFADYMDANIFNPWAWPVPVFATTPIKRPMVTWILSLKDSGPSVTGGPLASS